MAQNRVTRRGRVVSSRPLPYFMPGKDPVPIVQEAWWTPGPVWTGGKSRHTGIRSPDRPARSQSLYRLSYPAHIIRQDRLDLAGELLDSSAEVRAHKTSTACTISVLFLQLTKFTKMRACGSRGGS